MILTFLLRFSFSLHFSLRDKTEAQVNKELKEELPKEAYGPNFLFLCPQNSPFLMPLTHAKEKNQPYCIFLFSLEF